MQPTTSSTQFTKEELLHNFWGCALRTLEQYGEKAFIVTQEKSTTFKEANQRANVIFNAIKNNLKTKGVGIGLYIKEPHVIIPAMIGVLKSGNYFVPLDVGFPKTMLMDIVKTAEVNAILTVSDLSDQIHSYLEDNLPILAIDQLDYRDEIPEPIVDYSPEDIVQILFTSGSTGHPKGTIEDYRYLIRAIFIKLSTYDYEPDERIVQTSGFTFAGPHVLVFTALMNGNTLCYYIVADKGIAGLPDWIRQQGITSYTSVPTIFRNFVSILKPDDKFPSIHTISFGGEKRIGNDIEAIRRIFPNAKRIRLGFNSTETQEITSTIFPIDYNFDLDQLPSGTPYKDVQIFIWDKDGNSLPQGQEGEIVVHGDALARGYINNPKLTKEKFVSDPTNYNWQFYKTGDFGKLLPDGQLIHLGRMDNVVKIKGVRVELESIERHLMSYPGIAEVTTKAIDKSNGAKRLAAYFVTKNDLEIPISELRKHLAERLPVHSLPHYLIHLKQLPRNRNNKIAYDQLPLPKMERPNLVNEFVPPSNELEQKLLELWEDQLGTRGLGVTDDFFEVGGDSLLGALLFAAVEETLGRNLPVSILLKAPTIRQQASWIRTNDVSQDTSAIIPIRPTGDLAPLFFIPGKGGYPTRIRELTKDLDKRIPLYACQDLIGRKDSNFFHSVETTAAYFLNAIKKIYPHGPYILIGESVGGKVAFEIAQTLISQGEKAPILILLDTLNNDEPINKNRLSRITIYIPKLIQKHLFILSQSSWQGKRDYIKFYLDLFIQRGKRSIHRDNGIKNKTDVALPENIRKIEAESRMASQYYEPKPYPGKVILIKALKEHHTVTTANGWDKVQLGELIVHTIDCYHGSILFEPAVSQVAGIIQGLLE